MEATGQIYDFSSSFPSRFSTIFAAIDIFMKNEEWSNYMNDLEEVNKKTGGNEMVRPIVVVKVTGIIGLILLVLVCTVCWISGLG